MTRPDDRRSIGIDIGGTHVRAARLTAGGVIEEQRRHSSRHDAGAMLADCLALIAELRTSDVQGVGIGVPGQVDSRTRKVFSGGYVDLSTIPFADRLAEGTGLPLAIENDGAMALLGEHAWGAARGRQSAVLIAIGTGIGGAILEDGRLLRGRRSAGQLGHILVEPDGRPCLCGNRGCVETTTAGPALARHLHEAGFPEGTRVEDLLAARGGPGDAVLRTWVAPLRRAIDSLVAALDPEVIVLGGGLGLQAAAALDRLPPSNPGWFRAPVVPARLGDDAGVIGAGLAGLRAAQTGAKRVVLVNGVPASGKSTVARGLARELGWPLLTLDTIKQPFLDELPPGDRLFNRTLGRAAYGAIWALLADASEGSFVLDAWFGFQPLEVLQDGLRDAGVAAVAEVWCTAPAEEIGRRYAERVPTRGPGHPGLDYVPELVALAARSQGTGLGPMQSVDTMCPLDPKSLANWVRGALQEAH